MEFGDYVRKLISSISNSKKIIFIFDEFDKVEFKIKEGLFKPGFLLYFRAFFQHNHHVCAIVCGNFDFNKLNSREWKEFFTIFSRRKIGMLEKDSAIELVTKPVKDTLQYDQHAVGKILDFSGRNPFYIQLLCHTLINYFNEKKEKNFVEVKDVNTVILDKAARKIEPTLKLTWDELSQIEKNILFTLSQIRIQEKKSIDLDELDQCLKENNIRIERWKLRDLLDSLEEKDILTKSGGSSPFYDFNILLLEDWIAEHGNLG